MFGVMEAFVLEEEALEAKIGEERLFVDFPGLVLKELAKNDLAHHEGEGLEEVECFAELVEAAVKKKGPSIVTVHQ